jgi:hypothetical protein
MQQFISKGLFRDFNTPTFPDESNGVDFIAIGEFVPEIRSRFPKSDQKSRF